MQLPASSFVPLLLITSPFLDSAAGHAIFSNSRSRPGRAQNSPFALPFWTWLRDSALKVALGGYSTSPIEDPRLTATDVYHSYDQNIVVRFNVTTAEDERVLATAIQQIHPDVWAWGQTVDFRIHKEALQPLLASLPESLQNHSIMIEDLPSAILDSYPSEEHHEEWRQPEGTPMVDRRHRHTPGDGDEGLYFFRNYQPHNVVTRWMRLVEVLFPSFVRFTTVGKTYEGREIPALIVGVDSDSKTPCKPRKTLVVMGGSHAREWISTTTVNYLAWAIITSYGHDRLITKFLKEYDVIFVPEMNPDGIDYTWNSDRLWRKSRQPTKMSPWCLGLDLDHAFGYRWAGRRSDHSDDPCSESYAGQEPWESIEVSAFRDWAKREAETNNVNFVGLVDLHSYSQQILFPYAYTCDAEPPNLEHMEELALGLSKSIRLYSGEIYSVKPACQGTVLDTTRSGAGGLRVEPSGGSAIDWFYHELGAHYSYQIKLRDIGSYGFLLPPEQIIPTGDEILQALKYLGDYLLGNDGIETVNSEEGAEASERVFAVPQTPEEVIMELKRRERQ